MRKVERLARPDRRFEEPVQIQEDLFAGGIHGESRRQLRQRAGQFVQPRQGDVRLPGRGRGGEQDRAQAQQAGSDIAAVHFPESNPGLAAGQG